MLFISFPAISSVTLINSKTFFSEKFQESKKFPKLSATAPSFWSTSQVPGKRNSRITSSSSKKRKQRQKLVEAKTQMKVEERRKS